MRNFATLVAFAAGASALVPRQSSCCFHITASGEASGTVGQLGDGQNRIGGGLPEAQFCIDTSTGSITDGGGRACILTPPTTQFQCDASGNPTPGFSINSDGQLEHNGDSAFIACETGEDDELNLYTTNSSDVTNCRSVTLNADSCAAAGSSSSSVPVVPSSSAPVPSSTVPVVSPSPSVPGSEVPGQGPSTSAPCECTTATVWTTVAVGCSETPIVPVPVPGESETPGVPPGTEPGPGPLQTPPPGTSEIPGVPVPGESETPGVPGTESPVPSSGTPTPETPQPQPSGSPLPPQSSEPPSPETTQSQPSGTPQPSPEGCPTDLSGDFEFPHLIVPIDSSSPDNAAGSSLNGTVSSTVSTIFNFDIPASDVGKTCSLVFLFPKQEDLETSAFSLSGDGDVQFGLLESPATTSTANNNAPGMKQDFGEFTISPGNSYSIHTFKCPAGQTIGYKMATTGSTNLDFFEDFNPSPIGLYITVC